MKYGKYKFGILIFVFALLKNIIVYSEEKIKSVPLINLEELSPTFEEEKDELEKEEEKNVSLENKEKVSKVLKTSKNDKIYVNLKTLDKITAKTSDIKLVVGEKFLFGPLEIKVLKCQYSEVENIADTVAYLQVKDLSTKDNDQVFLFNGWTFKSSPTLQSIYHPIYDLWVISCENI